MKSTNSMFKIRSVKTGLRALRQGGGSPGQDSIDHGGNDADGAVGDTLVWDDKEMVWAPAPGTNDSDAP